jgi:Na+-driven multidrug efflux pump
MASSLLALVLGGVIIAFGTQLAGVFVGDHEERIVAMAHQYLVTGASLYVFLAVLFVVRAAIQGLGSTMMPTLAGVMELVARSLASLVLINPLGFLGVAVAAPLAWLFALIPLLTSWVIHRHRMLRAEAVAELPLGAPHLALAAA